MGSDPYTNRELDMIFNEISEKLDKIHTQTVATNGRVQSLEKWRAYTTGGLAVLTMLVIPVLLFVVTRVWIGT